MFLLVGYAVGIIRKCVQVSALHASGLLFYLSFVFYVLNFIQIGIDILLYFRNAKLDREREAALDP